MATRFEVIDGRVYKKEGDGKWEPSTRTAMAQEQAIAQSIEDMSFGERVDVGIGKASQDAWLGLQQIIGGPNDARTAEMRQMASNRDYRPMEQYGGMAPKLGEMLPTIALGGVGRYPAQMGFGMMEGMVTNPQNPVLGTAVGAGSTVLGDYVGRFIQRLGRNVFGVNSLQRAFARGNEYTRQLVRQAQEKVPNYRPSPAQRTGDRAAMDWEKMRSREGGTFNELDVQRRAENQMELNRQAAATLGINANRITPDVVREAIDNSKRQFDALATELDSPVRIDAVAIDNALAEMGPRGEQYATALLKRHGYSTDADFQGMDLKGPAFAGLRNSVAKAMRSNENIIQGVAEDLGSIMRVIDDSLEEANPYLADRIAIARSNWKATKIVEDALWRSGTQNLAAGDITANAGMRVLAKYDKGGFLRGRTPDTPFEALVRAMAATGERPTEYIPSPKRNFLRQQMNEMLERPLLEEYFARDGGGALNQYLLGLGEGDVGGTALQRTLGAGPRSAGIGLMSPEQDDENAAP